MPCGTILSLDLCPTNITASPTRPNGDNITGPSIYGRNDYCGNYRERAVRCFPGTDGPNDDSDQGDKSGVHRGVTLTVSEPINSITTLTGGTTHTIVVGEAHEANFGMWIGHNNFLDQSALINTRNGTVPGTVWAFCQVAKTNKTVGKLGCDLSQDGPCFWRPSPRRRVQAPSPRRSTPSAFPQSRTSTMPARPGIFSATATNSTTIKIHHMKFDNDFRSRIRQISLQQHISIRIAR